MGWPRRALHANGRGGALRRNVRPQGSLRESEILRRPESWSLFRLRTRTWGFDARRRLRVTASTPDVPRARDLHAIARRAAPVAPPAPSSGRLGVAASCTVSRAEAAHANFVPISVGARTRAWRLAGGGTRRTDRTTSGLPQTPSYGNGNMNGSWSDPVPSGNANHGPGQIGSTPRSTSDCEGATVKLVMTIAPLRGES